MWFGMPVAYPVDLQKHALALQPHTFSDLFSQGDYNTQLTPEAGQWNVNPYPFLATMAARAEQVNLQLEAIDADTFPRMNAEVEEWEICQVFLLRIC